MTEFPVKVNADSKDIKELAHLTYQKWSSLKGLFVSLIVLNLILCIYHLIQGWNFCIISFPSTNILLSTLWFIIYYIPHTPKNKIGFFIAINCENSETFKTFKSDFIACIQKALDLGNTGHLIYFKILPNYISERINTTEYAVKLTHKYNANFLLYGRVRKRVIDKVETSVIDLNGVVTHKPLTQKNKSALTKEFAELLPGRVFIDNENDILKYEITAQCLDIISKYIIGISFFVSGLNAQALMLYHEVNLLLKTQQTNLSAIIKMRRRMPSRFYEIYSHLANFEYNEWLNKEGNYSLEEFKNCVLKMSELCSNIGPVHLYKAILLFLESRSVSEARAELNLCKNVDKTILFCNYAFLYGYMGALSSARANYKKAIKSQVPIQTINQIEDFIVIILKIEPERYTLYYCLAWINLCIKNDIKQGKKDLNEFIKKDSESKYADEIRITQNYIKELEK